MVGELEDVISRGYTVILPTKSGKHRHLEVEWKRIMLVNILRVWFLLSDHE